MKVILKQKLMSQLKTEIKMLILCLILQRFVIMMYMGDYYQSSKKVRILSDHSFIPINENLYRASSDEVCLVLWPSPEKRDKMERAKSLQKLSRRVQSDTAITQANTRSRSASYGIFRSTLRSSLCLRKSYGAHVNCCCNAVTFPSLSKCEDKRSKCQNLSIWKNDERSERKGSEDALKVKMSYSEDFQEASDEDVEYENFRDNRRETSYNRGVPRTRDQGTVTDISFSTSNRLSRLNCNKHRHIQLQPRSSWEGLQRVESCDSQSIPGVEWYSLIPASSQLKDTASCPQVFKGDCDNEGCNQYISRGRSPFAAPVEGMLGTNESIDRNWTHTRYEKGKESERSKQSKYPISEYMTKCSVFKNQMSSSPSKASIIPFKTSPSVDGSFNDTQKMPSELFIFSGPSRICLASDVNRNLSEEYVNREDQLERSITPVKGKVRTNSLSSDISPMSSPRPRRGSTETKSSAINVLVDSIESDEYSETSDDSSCDDSPKVSVAQYLSRISVQGMRAFARSCRFCFRVFFKRKKKKRKKRKKRDRRVSPTVGTSRTVQENLLPDMADINSPLDCRLKNGRGKNSRKKKRPGTRISDEKGLDTSPKTSTSKDRRSGADVDEPQMRTYDNKKEIKYENVGSYNKFDKRKMDFDLIQKYLEDLN